MATFDADGNLVDENSATGPSDSSDSGLGENSAGENAPLDENVNPDVQNAREEAVNFTSLPDEGPLVVGNPLSDVQGTVEVSDGPDEDQVHDENLYLETELDKRRGLPDSTNYLDRVQRENAEIQRAKVEGREPDLENPGPSVGSPLRTKAYLDQKSV